MKSNPKDLNAILHVLVLWLILITPWTLILVDKDLFYPYVTTKVYAFRVVVDALFPLWLVLTFNDVRVRIPWRHPVILSFGLLLIWVFICNLAGIDPRLSFWSSLERSEGGLGLLHLFLYFIASAGMLNTRRRQQLLILSVLLVILVIMVLGWAGVGETEDKRRVASVLGNPIYYGNLMVFGLFLSLFLTAFINQSWRSSYLWYGWSVVATALVYSVFASATRASLLSLVLAVLGGITIGLILKAQTIRGRLIGLCAVLVSGVASIGILFAYRVQIMAWSWVQNNLLLARLFRVFDLDQTTSDRFSNWHIAIDTFKQHSWLGWGQENYSSAFHEFYRAGVLDNAKTWFDRAHNGYLDWLVAAGAPGLAFYCLLVGSALWAVWSKTTWGKLEKIAVSGFFLAYLGKNITGFDPLSASIVLVSILAIIVGQERASDQTGVGEMSNRFQVGLTVTGILVGVSLAYMFAWQPFVANQTAANAVRFANIADRYPSLPKCYALSASGSSLRREQVFCEQWKQVQYKPSHRYAPSLNMLKSAYQLDSKLGQKLFVDLRSKQSIWSSNADAEIAAEFEQEMIQIATTELARNNRNWKLKYYLAIFYFTRGQMELGQQTLRDLIEATPDKTVFYIPYAEMLLNLGRFDEAKTAYDKAKQLNGSYAGLKALEKKIMSARSQ